MPCTIINTAWFISCSHYRRSRLIQSNKELPKTANMGSFSYVYSVKREEVTATRDGYAKAHYCITRNAARFQAQYDSVAAADVHAHRCCRAGARPGVGHWAGSGRDALWLAQLGWQVTP